MKNKEIRRILHSCRFDQERAAKEIVSHNKWKKEVLPIVLTDVMCDILSGGLFYIHGRDKSLRPINIFWPLMVLKIKPELEDAIAASHFVDQYWIQYLMTPGKVENWTSILDLGGLSMNSLPVKYIIDFIKEFSHNYYQRTRGSVMLNATFAVRAVWNIVKAFVDPATKSKLIIEGKNTSQALQERIHPKQLQKKYGGEAEDIEVFWPPYFPSNEYGVDPEKLRSIQTQRSRKNIVEEESSVTNSPYSTAPEEECKQIHKNHHQKYDFKDKTITATTDISIEFEKKR